MLVLRWAVLCCLLVLSVDGAVPTRLRQNSRAVQRMRRLRRLRQLREMLRERQRVVTSPAPQLVPTSEQSLTTQAPAVALPAVFEPAGDTDTAATTSTAAYRILALQTTQLPETVAIAPADAPPPAEGQIRVSGGRGPYEGNIEIFHDGSWGFICDDEWDMPEAEIGCRQLGYQSALKPTHDGFYGHPTPENVSFWMDNMYCLGNERSLSECRFDGWAQHDCAPSELAGLSCLGKRKEDAKATETPTELPPVPEVPKHSLWKATKGRMKLRLRGGRVATEGRLEVRVSGSGWGVVCGDGWNLVSANVVCRHLGLGYASSALQTGFFGGNGTQKLLSGLRCVGTEKTLMDCQVDEALFCPGDPLTNLATVVCQQEMADLVPDHLAIMQSAYLEDKQMFYLQCAMEENCLASSAYRIRKENGDWHLMPRRLLRFTTKVMNKGTASFRPFLPKENWEWHQCHMHFHSMEVFSTYEVTDEAGRRVAEGHKASFCLEDSHCSSGVEPTFSCANFGDQGVSVGCADSYAHNIDCQWLDVTDIDPGKYQLRVIVNGEYKVGEQSWENNAVSCDFEYATTAGTVTNCRLGRP